MESIGDKLRLEREQKSLSIEQIARDTNIAKRFLRALEEEDFSVFPGDPYLIGFLRNYADYLGLDPQEMVSLYRNFTIQSQPAPIEELLDRSRPKRVRTIIIVVFIVAALATGGVFLYPVLFGSGGDEAVPVEPAKPEGVTYQLEEQYLERRFIVDDIVTVAIGSAEYSLAVAGIDANVTLEVPGGTNVMRVGDERAVDLDGDNKMDVIVSLTDIDSDAKPASALMRISRYGIIESAAVTATTANTEAGEAGAGTAVVGTPALSSRVIEPVIIARSEALRPFRGSVIFRGYCLVRYVIDGEQREERYFQKGETLELDISRELRLWISNAGNMIIRVDGIELDLGRPGEVSTRIVSWNLEAGSGQYLLSMVPMY